MYVELRVGDLSKRERKAFCALALTRARIDLTDVDFRHSFVLVILNLLAAKPHPPRVAALKALPLGKNETPTFAPVCFASVVFFMNR